MPSHVSCHLQYYYRILCRLLIIIIASHKIKSVIQRVLILPSNDSNDQTELGEFNVRVQISCFAVPAIKSMLLIPRGGTTQIIDQAETHVILRNAVIKPAPATPKVSFGQVTRRNERRVLSPRLCLQIIIIIRAQSQAR